MCRARRVVGVHLAEDPGDRRHRNVATATTQPLLILGGSPGPDPEATFASWERALEQPTVRGLVVGRALLYPPDGDVESAVGRAAELVAQAVGRPGPAIMHCGEHRSGIPGTSARSMR